MDTQRSQIKEYLEKIVQEDRVPHAVLILGPEGSGQLQTALEWCKLLFCDNIQGSSFCGECKSCQKIGNFVHPDIHFSFPVVKHDKFKREDTTSLHFLKEWRSFMENNIHGNLEDWLNSIGASDKQSNMNVAECNQIIHNLALKTYEDKYKVQIIWHAESLAKEGNRLLKLIEEPADNTIIMLIANNHNAILNTIRSRCQILKVPAFSDTEIKEYLSENFELGEDELREISYLSEGNIRKARTLAEQSSMNFSAEMLDWFRKAFKSDPEELIEINDRLSSIGKASLKSFMAYTLHFLREYLKALNLQSTNGLRLSDEEKNVILKMQKILDREKCAQLRKLFNENIAYIDRNVSVKIMLMNMSLKINEILRPEVNKFA